MSTVSFINRDVSWLSFNERVLLEAGKSTVPLQERLRFIAIFSSNLDEFYRVRMPWLQVLHKLRVAKKKIRNAVLENEDVYEKAKQIIWRQSHLFGNILCNEIIPQFRSFGIHIVYDEPIPKEIAEEIHDYFFEHIAGLLEIIFLHEAGDFLPENNKLYFSIGLKNKKGKEHIALVNIPGDPILRFFMVSRSGTKFIIFIDDIIRANLSFLFPKLTITGAYSIKITRDAKLDLSEEIEGDIAEKIERQLAKRDYGTATRFLYPPDMPSRAIKTIAKKFSLLSAMLVEGGNYHNLSNFASLPVLDPVLVYRPFHSLRYRLGYGGQSLFEEILSKDILIHTPYQDYGCILRFFNEAAARADVEEIFVTVYRVAADSMIGHALISAAKNGKKVTVFIEVKARFDELNNIRWAKKMKSAGIHIIYSVPELKVHAKVALVRGKRDGKGFSLGLLATGNLNEVTAKFYTDHILLTRNQAILIELESLFQFLKESEKPKTGYEITLKHLLVSQFNLLRRFLGLIQDEIDNFKEGLASGITIKVNNLEEESLISKLYEASQTGVKVHLIVRGICRLRPGVPGMSENITVKRIVGRFLEHSRVFMFCHGGEELIYLGSSDLMNRNIYQRIEVCFPIYEETLKKEIKEIIRIQLDDNVSAVALDQAVHNVTLEINGPRVDSQDEIFRFLQQV